MSALFAYVLARQNTSCEFMVRCMIACLDKNTTWFLDLNFDRALRQLPWPLAPCVNTAKLHQRARTFVHTGIPCLFQSSVQRSHIDGIKLQGFRFWNARSQVAMDATTLRATGKQRYVTDMEFIFHEKYVFSIHGPRCSVYLFKKGQRTYNGEVFWKHAVTSYTTNLWIGRPQAIPALANFCLHCIRAQTFSCAFFAFLRPRIGLVLFQNTCLK